MLITVRVHPRASRARTSWTAEQLDVWVTAPPVGNAANDAVVKAVAKELGVPTSAVTIRSGKSSRTKLVEVRTPAPADRRRRSLTGGAAKLPRALQSALRRFEANEGADPPDTGHRRP